MTTDGEDVVEPDISLPTVDPQGQEVLSADSQVEEVTTTVDRTEEPHDIQIQGSDRRSPAIVLRRKHRGVGGTILTVSKTGTHADLYADYADLIESYLARRRGRVVNDGAGDSTSPTADNTPDNTPDNTIGNIEDRREVPTTFGYSEGGTAGTRVRWLDQAIQIVENRSGNAGQDLSGDSH